EGVVGRVAGEVGVPDGLAAVVDPAGVAVRPAEGAQVAGGGDGAVGGCAVGVLGRVGGGDGVPDGLAAGVDAVGVAANPAEGAQVAGGGDGAVGVRAEGVIGRVAGGGGGSDGLAAGVDDTVSSGEATIPTQGPQVQDGVRGRGGCRGGRRQCGDQQENHE